MVFIAQATNSHMDISICYAAGGVLLSSKGAAGVTAADYRAGGHHFAAGAPPVVGLPLILGITALCPKPVR
ncbi:hypothetical protein ACNKHS_20925 [Shigella flexneri]